MKRLLLSISITLFLATSMNAQLYNPEATEQMKRTIRTNNHIQKKMNGQIVKNLFRGTSKGLYAFVFKSDADEYYHVSLRGGGGNEIMPYLKTNEPVELTVTGDPKLLQQVMHLKNEYLRIENTMDIRLTGLAHFSQVKSATGTYRKKEKSSRFSATREPDTFHEDVAIVAKKKVPGNAWAYILENQDTLVVKYEDDDQLKGKKRLSYFTSASPLVRGGYFKAPNTYNFVVQHPHTPAKRLNAHWMMAGRAAFMVENDRFEVSGNTLDTRGLLNGFSVKQGATERALFFNAKNGERILSAVEGRNSFEAYYKTIGDDSLMLYAVKNGDALQFFDNNETPFAVKNHYGDSEVTFTGNVSAVHLQTGNQSAKLKSFIVNDSIHVAIKEVVALNIQKMIKEGKKVSITGRIRKEVPGEVNEKGYSIMALSEIVVNGKTFNQTLDVSRVL